MHHFSFQKELYEQEGQLRFPVTRPRESPLLIFETPTKELGGLDKRTYPEIPVDKDLVKWSYLQFGLSKGFQTLPDHPKLIVHIFAS